MVAPVLQGRKLSEVGRKAPLDRRGKQVTDKQINRERNKPKYIKVRLKSIFRFEGEIQQKNRTESRFQRGVCQKVVRARLESACHCGKTRRTEASGQNILNVLPGGHRLSGYLSFY